MWGPSPTRELLIIHTLTNLHGAIFEVELRTYTKVSEISTPDQVEFTKALSTIVRSFTLRCFGDQEKAQNKRLYGFFIDFPKAFDNCS